MWILLSDSSNGVVYFFNQQLFFISRLATLVEGHIYHVKEYFKNLVLFQVSSYSWV